MEFIEFLGIIYPILIGIAIGLIILIGLIAIPKNKRTRFHLIKEVHKNGETNYKVEIDTLFGFGGYLTVYEFPNEKEAEEYIRDYFRLKKIHKSIEKQKKENPIVQKTIIKIKNYA